MTNRILIAGIGNIFHGDDAFGVEVVRQLLREPLPEGVHAADFGIRSYDLAFALMDGYETALLIDATQQGGSPGTLYLIEPDLASLKTAQGDVVNGHSLNPVRVLLMVKQFGGEHGRLYVLGCEPAVLDVPDGQLGLSEPVAAAVTKAVTMIHTLLDELLQPSDHTESGLSPSPTA